MPEPRAVATETSHRSETDDAARNDWRQLQEAFLDLLELGPAQRRRALDDYAPALRGELRTMLAAHGESAALEIETRLQPEIDADAALIGRRIGPYRIDREIGRGGMGTVFLAHRSDGYEQDVALKIMRWGLGGAEMAERFRRERQILARLEHPHIAQLLDGGVSEDGRPYLVMQAIDGRPITEYCDARQLDVAARLELFGDICDAVDYAHRNLVVHRDLKPSNILVAEVQGKPRVQLLDFGIAKLLEADDGLGPTRSEARVMTPEHAAPEQVRGEAVTTATDTYALGVVLYELLVGVRPFVGAGLGRAELEAQICERAPTAPSQALRARSESSGLADARGTSPPKLARRLRGDLDTIVVRALAKEPSRRYGSASALADDVRRHLAGLPVLARPDALSYRLGRFVARHRWQVAAGAALLLLAVAFVVTTVRQSRALERERDEARVERATAEQVADVLVELFEQANPSRTADGRKLTVDELLEQHSEQAVERLDGQPAVQARLRHMLGRVHQAHSRFDDSRRLYADALEQRRRQVGPDDPLVLTIEHDLAVLARDVGDRGRAERLLRASLDAHRRVHGARHESVAQALQDLATVLPVEEPEKTSLLEASLDIRRELEPEPGILTASSLNDLALIDMWSLRLDRAIARFREVGALVETLRGPDHPHTLAVRGNLAASLMRAGRFAEARELEEDLLRRKRAAYGDESMVIADALNNLGNTLANLGDWPSAEEAIRQALETSRALVGDEHVRTVNTTRNLARLLEIQGRPDEALELLERADAARLEVAPGEEPFFANQQAALAMRLGAPERAVRDLLRIAEELEELFPDGDYRVTQTQVMLGEALLLVDGDETRRIEHARAAAVQYRRAYEFQTREPLRSEAGCGLARALARLPEPVAVEEARRLFDECLSPYQAWGLVHPETKEAVFLAAEAVFVGTAPSRLGSSRPDG
ncbi:MAG: serine/threonine-protein kinase [Acidobacteriota bacterium]